MLYIIAHVDVDGIVCHTITEMWARKSGISTKHYFVDYQNIEKGLRILCENIEEGDQILIADIGYSNYLVDIMFNQYAMIISKISWFDHHKWEEKALAKIKSIAKEVFVDEKFCASEILQRRFLPDDILAKTLASLARAHDFPEISSEDEFTNACKIQDVIMSGYPKEAIVNHLLRGEIWNVNLEKAYNNYQCLKADEIEKMDKTIEKYCLSIDGTTTSIALALAVESLEAKDVRRHLFQECNCDAVIALWPNGRIAYEVLSEKLMAISKKINNNFNGGGRGLVGGATYPSFISLDTKKSCFNHIVKVLEV